MPPVRRWLPLLALTALLAHGCGERPTISTDGLGRECPVEGCAEGQECVTSNGLSTCEIPCDVDVDCPDEHRCNLPPILPGSLPNVCIAS